MVHLVQLLAGRVPDGPYMTDMDKVTTSSWGSLMYQIEMEGRGAQGLREENVMPVWRTRLLDGPQTKSTVDLCVLCNRREHFVTPFHSPFLGTWPPWRASRSEASCVRYLNLGLFLFVVKSLVGKVGPTNLPHRVTWFWRSALEIKLVKSGRNSSIFIQTRQLWYKHVIFEFWWCKLDTNTSILVIQTRELRRRSGGASKGRRRVHPEPWTLYPKPWIVNPETCNPNL